MIDLTDDLEIEEDGGSGELQSLRETEKSSPFRGGKAANAIRPTARKAEKDEKLFKDEKSSDEDDIEILDEKDQKDTKILEPRFDEQSGRFICQICERSYSTKAHFKDHLQSHTGEYKFRCDICGRGFCGKSRYTSHMRSKHEGVKYHCEFCDKVCATKQGIRQHLTTHLNDVEPGFKG